MLQKIIKYGNSHAVVLPREIMEQVDLSPGDWVQVEVKNHRVQIAPVDVVPKLSGKDREFVDELYKRRRRVFKKLAE